MKSQNEFFQSQNEGIHEDLQSGCELRPHNDCHGQYGGELNSKHMSDSYGSSNEILCFNVGGMGNSLWWSAGGAMRRVTGEGAVGARSEGGRYRQGRYRNWWSACRQMKVGQ